MKKLFQSIQSFVPFRSASFTLGTRLLKGHFLGSGSRMGENHFLQLTPVQQAELSPLFLKERGWPRLGVAGGELKLSSVNSFCHILGTPLLKGGMSSFLLFKGGAEVRGGGFLFILVMALFGFSSCNTDDKGGATNVDSFTNGVFVVHEGNFQGGNAGLSFFNKYNNEMSNGVFTAVNSIPLGDVGQSMVTLGDVGYVVVNNSGKVEVVNLEDLSSKGTITGLSSPRYICIVSNSTAYVSDLFSGAITVFNPQTLATSGTITVTGQIEEMVKTSSGVIAAGTGANQVYKINATNNTLIDSVNVGIGPSNVVRDANGKVWVMTNGGFGTEAPKLVRIDPATLNVELSLDFASTDFPSSLKTNAAGTSLYWANGGVFKMDISASSLPITAFLSTAVYKVNADPETDMVYVSDAGDFNSNGKVYRYQSDGTPVDTFNVGVIPGEFAFTE